MADILVIDDDDAVRTTVKILLERARHRVVVTDDGRKGIELFKNGSFDVLIVDIFMPAMDGLETMSLVHRLRPAVPIIVISGHHARSSTGKVPDFLRMATRLGAVSSIQKPFRSRDLLTAVDNCLSALPNSPPNPTG